MAKSQVEHHMRRLGSILAVWSQFELLLECIIKRELRINVEETSIICGSLGGGAKTSLAYALLSRNPNNADLISALRKVQEVTGRNALAHGFIFAEEQSEDYQFVSREVKTKLTVKSGSFESASKLDAVLKAVYLALGISQITERDLDEYAKEIISLSQPPQSPVQHSP